MLEFCIIKLFQYHQKIKEVLEKLEIGDGSDEDNNRTLANYNAKKASFLKRTRYYTLQSS